MRLSTLGLLLAVLLWSCSGEESKEDNNPDDQAETSDTNSDNQSKATKDSGDSEPVPEIQFKREERFGSTDEVLVGEIAAVDVDDSNRVYIADADKKSIWVFSPDGSYRTSMGREGKGPGEFSRISSMKIYAGQLVVADANPIPTRLNVYSLASLSYSHTVRLRPEYLEESEELEGYIPNRFYPMDDSSFLVRYDHTNPPNNAEVRFSRYYMQDEKGRIISDQILEQKNNYLTHKIENGVSYTVAYGDFPFIGGSIFAVSNKGNLYSAWTEEFLVKVYDRNGNYLREFEHPYSRKEINRQEIMESLESETRRQTVANNNLPEKWPSLTSMFFDDKNRLWVATIVDDMDVYEWWVLENTGEVIAKFEWPRDHPIEEVRNGKLYAREIEEETGLEKIVRYDIGLITK